MNGRCAFCNKPLTTGDFEGICQLCKTAILPKADMLDPKLEKYAKHLAIMYPQYRTYQYNGKNGANSDNEKGYWRGMADSVLAFLQDLKRQGLIEHTGIQGDNWPKEELNNE